MVLKLGIQHWVLKYYQIYSNGDHGLTLTHFTHGLIWSLLLLYGENLMIFSETIVDFNIKLVEAVNQMSTRSFKNIIGQGHSFTFVQGHSDSTFSNFCSL